MRVLIIDDSRDASHSVSVLVKYFGHEAMALTVPQAAVDIATDWKPELVLLDLAMTGMDSYGVAQQLRERAGLKGTRIIALSGYQQDAELEKCAGIDGHILKPITAKRLATLLDGQSCSLGCATKKKGTVMDMHKLAKAVESLQCLCNAGDDSVERLNAEVDQLWSTGIWSDVELRQLHLLYTDLKTKGGNAYGCQ